MQLIPLKLIDVGPRQRSTIATGPLNDLKASILTLGLLNPPVAWFDPTNAKWVLVAGERRLRALTEITESKDTFRCGGDVVDKGLIPITPLGDYLDATGRFEAELDENIKREDLEWQDRVRALAALHTMRLTSNPDQTVHDTAKELSQKAGYALDDSGRGARSAHRALSQAIVINRHLNSSKIANARNANEAIQLIYKQEEEKVLAAIIKRQIAAAPSKPDIEIRNADLHTLLPKLDSDRFDLIVADPPYGIGASGPGYRARSVIHHSYSDTPEEAKRVALCILTEGFRITKPRSNLFMFCDIDLFPWLKLTASNMGWSVFRRPLIWIKSESEGMAPWGGQGFRITTEFIFYATKGQRGLNASPVDVFDHRRVQRHVRTHGAEKPVGLLRDLISCSSLPGDSVLDPCCGSGSTLVAAKETGRSGLGIEIDPDYYNTALANVFGKTTTP